MIPENLPKKKPEKREWRHPDAKFPIGLRKAAKVLGYACPHLSLTIRGERVSPPTLRAYRALCEKQGIDLDQWPIVVKEERR